MSEQDHEVIEGGWDPRRVFEVALGVPVSEGNHVRVLRNGDRIFPEMLEAIEGAERSVDFLTFVYWTGDIAKTFAQALAERAEAGVRVRVLLDALGARQMNDQLFGLMVDAGCVVEKFRPVGGDATLGEAYHRTHRKVLVCDGTVGFTGGVGIAAEWTGDAGGPDEWRDTHYRIEGPGVDGLRAAFLQNWAETGHSLLDAGVDELGPQPRPGSTALQVIPDGDGTGPGATSLAFHLMLAGAEHRVRIATAYFTPDDDMLEHIVEAAQRGVEVEVLVPGEHSDKSMVRWAGEQEYRLLLDAGVSVQIFQPSMLHAKVMTADGRVAVVGSSNINTRSVSDDDEVIVTIFDQEIIEELDRDFDNDLERAVDLDPEDWASRGLLRRVAAKVSSAASDFL